MSSKWIAVQEAYVTQRNRITQSKSWWASVVVGKLLLIHSTIWVNWNSQFHGVAEQEDQRQIRVQTERQVWKLHASPPDLLARFQRIEAVPLDERLWKGTRHLRAWLREVGQQRRLGFERGWDKELFGDITHFFQRHR